MMNVVIKTSGKMSGKIRRRTSRKTSNAKALGARMVLCGAFLVPPAAALADVPSSAQELSDSARVGEQGTPNTGAQSDVGEVVMEPTRVLAAHSGGSRGANAQLALTQSSGPAASETLGRARASLSQLRRGVAGLDGIMKYAQAQKDAYPASCVARRRAMGDAVVRLGQEAVSAVEEALRRSDTAEAQYHMSRLQLMGEKVKTLLAEGNLCVHDDASFVQISRREVQIDRGIPDDDPAAAPTR